MPSPALYLLYEHLYVFLVSSPGISTLSYIGFRDQSSGCVVGGLVHFAGTPRTTNPLPRSSL